MHSVRPENAAAEERVMAVGRDASVAMLAEVLPQPHFLRRTVSAPSESLRRTIRVQHDHVPGAEFITVIALPKRSSLLSPILKIRCRAALPILVVPQGGLSAFLEFAPRGAITVLELRQGKGIVDQILNRADRTRKPVHALLGSPTAFPGLASDHIPRPH